MACHNPIVRQQPPHNGAIAPAWAQWTAAALVAGGVLWIVAGAVIVWQPGPASASSTYSTLVPLTVVLLLVGLVGVDGWLGGWTGRTRSARRSGLAAAARAMSDERHAAVAADTDIGSGLSARRAGVVAVRVGGIAVVVAALLLQGQPNGLRSLLFFGWFVFFAGAVPLAIAIVLSDDVSRWPGLLVLAGSLLVFWPLTAVMSGTIRRPEMLGPLRASAEGIDVVPLLLWILLGAGCAWLGGALWSASRPAT